MCYYVKAIQKRVAKCHIFNFDLCINCSFLSQLFPKISFDPARSLHLCRLIITLNLCFLFSVVLILENFCKNYLHSNNTSQLNMLQLNILARTTSVKCSSDLYFKYTYKCVLSFLVRVMTTKIYLEIRFHAEGVVVLLICNKHTHMEVKLDLFQICTPCQYFVIFIFEKVQGCFI